MSSLPDDLLADVLCRLPVESLVKLRCVSKSWKGLIDSPEFSKLHLNRGGSSSRDHKFIFQGRISPLPPNQISALYIADLDSPEKTVASILKLHDLSETLVNIENLEGCCNGLLCLRYEDSTIVLWNPYINKLWTLPRPPSAQDQTLKHHARLVFYGFGYDVTADDYKVARLVELRRGAVGVMIYSLKSNSWRILRRLITSSLVPRRHDHVRTAYGGCGGVLANGALHWIMFDDLEARAFIVAVDLRTEKQHLLSLPRGVSARQGREEFCWELGVLEGRLCLIPDCEYRFGRRYFHMWAMREYGVKESWTRVTTIEQQNPRFDCGDYVRPISCSEAGPEIFFHGSHHLLWYNTEREELVQEAHLYEDPSSNFMRDGYHFVVSLVKPHGGSGTASACPEKKRKFRE